MDFVHSRIQFQDRTSSQQNQRCCQRIEPFCHSHQCYSRRPRNSILLSSSNVATNRWYTSSIAIQSIRQTSHLQRHFRETSWWTISSSFQLTSWLSRDTRNTLSSDDSRQQGATHKLVQGSPWYSISRSSWFLQVHRVCTTIFYWTTLASRCSRFYMYMSTISNRKATTQLTIWRHTTIAASWRAVAKHLNGSYCLFA